MLQVYHSFMSSQTVVIMAPTVAESAVALEISPISPPPAAHMLSDRTQRALLTPPPDLEMQNELRARTVRPAAQESESPSVSTPPSTPSSSADGEHTQAPYRLVLLAKAGWREFARFVQNPFSRPTPDELKIFNERYRYDRLNPRRVDQYQKGLPQLASFINSDDSFANFRRFGYLSARVLVHLELELTELEQELDKLDNTDAASDVLKKRLNGYDNFHGWNEDQKKLVDKIRRKYVEYAEVLEKDSGLRALGPTTERNHKQLLNWIVNNKPLGKYDFIFHRDDFVSSARYLDKEHYFEDLILSTIDWWRTGPHKTWFQSEADRSKTVDEAVFHLSAVRLSIAAKFLTILLAITSLLVPVFLLLLTSMSKAWMATVAIGFVLLFSVMMSVVTGARAQDLLFGTATFAAVVVAVVGNVGQNACAGNGSQ